MLNQSSKKIEPHVILHLRITKDDIDNYLESKIQIAPVESVGSVESAEAVETKEDIDIPLEYKPCNISDFTSAPLTNQPTPANFMDNSFETLGSNTSENEFGVIKNNFIFEQNISSETKSVVPSEPIVSKDVITHKTHIDYNLDVPHIDIDKIQDIPKTSPSDDPNCSDTKIKLITAMCEFADANRRNEWLKSTSIWCRWCVHPFMGPPVSIPKWYVNKTFFVSGCYCSYSCAAKHLFSRGDVDENNKWKYYQLLHLLRKKISGIDEIIRIRLAPPQDTLKVFGGHLSVEEFRNVTGETNLHHNIYNILEPPMISIATTIEKTSFDENNSDMRLLNASGGMRAYGNMKYVAPKNQNMLANKWGENKSYIPIDDERMKRAVENLKIKRKAPLLDKKKTLLHYMNLKINNKKLKNKESAGDDITPTDI